MVRNSVMFISVSRYDELPSVHYWVNVGFVEPEKGDIVTLVDVDFSD